MQSSVAPDPMAMSSHCPLAGRRAPELAAGEADKVVASVGDFSAADLMPVMQKLSTTQQGLLLADFETAKGKLILGLSMKYAEWSQLPHKLCVLGLDTCRGHFFSDEDFQMSNGIKQYPHRATHSMSHTGSTSRVKT